MTCFSFFHYLTCVTQRHFPVFLLVFFSFYSLVLVQSHCSHQPSCSSSWELFSAQGCDKMTVCCLPSTQELTDKVCLLLVSIEEHLAAKEPHISLRRLRKAKQT